MFSIGLMVEMSENFKSFLNLTRDLAGSSRNTRQSLASSHLCRLVAAICGHVGDGEYLEQSVPPPHPGALPAASTGARREPTALLAWLVEGRLPAPTSLPLWVLQK